MIRAFVSRDQFFYPFYCGYFITFKTRFVFGLWCVCFKEWAGCLPQAITRLVYFLHKMTKSGNFTSLREEVPFLSKEGRKSVDPRPGSSPHRGGASPGPGHHRAPGDKARTWTGASDCSFGGAPPRSGVASASPPGPPSPRTCGRPRRARAPPPPPLRLPREPETPHPPSPTAGSPLPRQPSQLRSTAPGGVGSGQDLGGLCHQDLVARTAPPLPGDRRADGHQGNQTPPPSRPASLSKFSPTKTEFLYDVALWPPPS